MKSKIFYIIISLFIISGCVPAVVGGIAAGGKALYQDRTVGEEISDTTIWAKIRASLVKESIDSPIGNIDIEVSEGRVLLTGSVDSREIMVQVVRICWQQDGVKEVNNELKLKEQIKGGLKQYAQDTWITTRIKSKLFFTKSVKSVNYNIITINGVAYIIGIAQSQEEMDLVTESASQVSGVKEVVSYIRVRKNLDEATGDAGISDSSIDEFNDKEISVDDFKDETPKSKKTTDKKQTKSKVSTKVKNKSQSKKEDDIFSEEDFDSF